MQKALLRLAACTALLLPFAVHALPLARLNQSALLHIPAQDVPSFKSFVGQTLNEGPAGTVAEWSSTARPGKFPVKVLLNPGAKVETQSAGQCRLLSAQVSQSRTAHQWKLWFCQQADGSWKISGLE
ncbi:hypothetical protein N0K08_11760 [Acidovorax sp. Be4]|uniref:Surface antigen domain-containing protein n=1 Tax=Acidovorax bellezanensis TaxID=2976702 RepID=A0ABT2PLG0_9BURK|nr:hypothetical protein [Acidovorax sp. Be4]MCT9811315.1 hypothetical protein [Acidovorax sp. Be4]